MERLRIESERGGYTVLVGRDLVGRLGEVLDREGVARPSACVTNVTVSPLYARAAAVAAGTGTPFELPDGEVHKRWAQVEATCARWLEQGVHRSAMVAAIGGGVVTDLVGFAAAVYLRGVQWVAVPTTLLAMVDAAVGGKTGINLDHGKNLVGAFWPPALVVADVDTLSTLAPRELRAGLAEVVKAAWIADHDLLDLVPEAVAGFSGLEPTLWQQLVGRAVAVKAEVVMADEREAGRRKALNLGHTIGHALESVTAYSRFLHGEAVAWGLLVAARLGHGRGLLSTAGECRLHGAVRRLGILPPIDDLYFGVVLEHLARDKKRDDLGVAWVLPTDDGVVLDQRVGADEARAALNAVHSG